MATVNAYTSLNLINPDPFFGDVVLATSTELIIANGSHIAHYHGFGVTYDDNGPVSGTLTGYSESYNGTVLGSVTDISVPAPVAAYYINAGDIHDLLAYALTGNDTIIGSASNDDLAGFGGDDRIAPGGGQDYVDGGDGLDSAVFAGNARNFHYTSQGSNVVVSANDGSEIANLINVERVSFDDGTLAFDANGDAGQTYRLYQAAFGRTPDTTGLSFWTNQMDQGTVLRTVARGFIGSAEFQSLYGSNPSNQQFVDNLYHNILGRDPDQSGAQFWDSQLDKGLDRAVALADFSESPENVSLVGPAIAHGIWLG